MPPQLQKGHCIIQADGILGICVSSILKTQIASSTTCSATQWYSIDAAPPVRDK